MLPTSSFAPSGNRKTAIRLQPDDDINVCFSLSRALCVYPVVYIESKSWNEKHSTQNFPKLKKVLAKEMKT